MGWKLSAEAGASEPQCADRLWRGNREGRGLGCGRGLTWVSGGKGWGLRGGAWHGSRIKTLWAPPKGRRL